MVKSAENNEYDTKARRIVYQMSQELEHVDVDEDFQQVLLSTRMDESSREAGFAAFLDLQDEIRESLNNLKEHGEINDWTSLLTSRQLKCVRQMLVATKSPEKSTRRSKSKNVRVVEDHPPEIQMFHIPPLDFGISQAHGQDDLQDDDIETVSSIPRSSRASNYPMEPAPKIPEHFEVVAQQPANPPKSILKKIISRPRPVEKSDAGVQTERIQVQKEIISTTNQETMCDLIRPEKAEIHSPISELSEGEIREIHVTDRNIICAHPDGSIRISPVTTYLGESEDDIDILRATSSSPLRVTSIDL
uniref:Uncharacterized protein n=1 Tax=Caenorhabditis japonica TaxID=281687 RepID=A0A8R1HK55_CAEJA